MQRNSRFRKQRALNKIEVLREIFLFGAGLWDLTEDEYSEEWEKWDDVDNKNESSQIGFWWKHTPLAQLIHCSRVNKIWNEASKDIDLWRNIKLLEIVSEHYFSGRNKMIITLLSEKNFPFHVADVKEIGFQDEEDEDDHDDCFLFSDDNKFHSCMDSLAERGIKSLYFNSSKLLTDSQAQKIGQTKLPTVLKKLRICFQSSVFQQSLMLPDSSTTKWSVLEELSIAVKQMGSFHDILHSERRDFQNSHPFPKLSKLDVSGVAATAHFYSDIVALCPSLKYFRWVLLEGVRCESVKHDRPARLYGSLAMAPCINYFYITRARIVATEKEIPLNQRNEFKWCLMMEKQYLGRVSGGQDGVICDQICCCDDRSQCPHSSLQLPPRPFGEQFLDIYDGWCDSFVDQFY